MAASRQVQTPPAPSADHRAESSTPKKEVCVELELLKLEVFPAVEAQEERLCPKHFKGLQLFCAEDHTLLCVLCWASHRDLEHTVYPIEEAAEGYRDTLQRHKEQLNTELQGLEQQRTEGHRTASDLEENCKSEAQRVCRTFENLDEFVEQKKQRLLKQLEQELEESLEKIQGPLTHLEEQLTTGKDLFVALEEKCGQLDVELLGDVPDILNLCESVKALNPKEDSEEDQNTQSLRQQDTLHEKIMEIKEGFPAELKWSYVKGFEREVTLDPDSTHVDLVVSEDGKSVRDGGIEQFLPDSPDRFECAGIVLGKQKLSSGRHYWEVEVGDAAGWDLGICDEFVSRKGDLSLKTEKGHWGVFLQKGNYYANTSPPTLLTPRVPPSVVGLFLDCGAAKLMVYDVRDRSLLFTFSEVSFSHSVRPLFLPLHSKSGKPGPELRILSGTGQE